MLKCHLRLIGNLHFNKISPGESYTYKCMLKSQLEPNRLSGKLGSVTHQLGDLAQMTSYLLCNEEFTYPKRGLVYTLGSREVISKTLECLAGMPLCAWGLWLWD